MIDQIKTNLAAVQGRIEAAARQSGRTAKDITLVAVTKYVEANVAKTLYEAGCRDLGESRPQALWEKSESLSDCDITWHMVGHLQRNKVKRTIGCAEIIHSVDSLRLIDAIDQAAKRHSGFSWKSMYQMNRQNTALRRMSLRQPWNRWRLERTSVSKV